ncbi:GNAT family N-acetyltransferase [Dyadobacter chenwenxiniae]|uniref:GNAT family N-acetyltransferase n=1 Tax=Dyadobacter chenwenxiniae TaxID=2906456 RepID=A0A9X1PJK7_9BACT|nr:GNAT family N-acetyltransferase [Dyadobacter chenwenxiniae]MCF0062537.1 GNAT family N-acetyltransferase [Dyadobacter chenwenxiniae]UON83719.1 GNAT family N-acetyltransferase [Dyadobacter chenwenxiniae]
MEITYKTDLVPSPEQVIELYDSAKLPRPTHDPERIGTIYQNSNLIVSAWEGEKLVGVSRSITDWAWSCYLADLAIHADYQKLGIGKRLIDITKEQVGEQTTILLLSVPTAMQYYPKIGFTKEDRGFTILRTK